MRRQPLISVCIPGYKRTDFIRRLLDSLCQQSFRNFEVVVTDDSPDNDILNLCEQYRDKLPLVYHKNAVTLGTPENWNEAVRRATGEWVKIMHDDDWFAAPDGLELFAKAISDHPEASFIFSAYRDVFLDEGREREMFVGAFRYRAFLKNKATLFSQNIVGPPSVVMYKKVAGIYFDPQVKWLVDIDFYIRYLESGQPVYIRRILINVGLGKAQVTRDCFRLRPVEIPENFYLLNKVGVGNLKNLLIYDAWWRLMRNLEIKKGEDILESGYTGNIPVVILSMISWQVRIGLRLLKIGLVSKTCMFLHYLSHYKRIPA
jgi:glycosyltransferase involved in cell wall biosynthesis